MANIKKEQAGREHPVAMVVRELWPVLQAVSAQHQSSDQVFEKLNRFFKHAMRTCKDHFEPLLQVGGWRLVVGGGQLTANDWRCVVA